MREQALEPAKKYVFGFHPHGIVLLSLLATYGGTWETVFPGVTTRGALPASCQRSRQLWVLLSSGADLLLLLLSVALGATTIFFIPFAREICLWCV